MNDQKKPLLFGPANQPIVGDDDLDLATFGGQQLRFFKAPNRAQTPTTGEAIVNMLGAHDLVVHALMREIVSLRARIVALESVEDDADLLT